MGDRLKPGDKFGITGQTFVRTVARVCEPELPGECKIVVDTNGSQWGIGACYPYREATRTPPMGDCRNDGCLRWAECAAANRCLQKRVEVEILPPLTEVQEAIVQECDNISNMLLAKNRQYGDSAMNPLRIFSRADAEEQLRVRIDDKLSRIARGTGENEEDTLGDLIGYLVLLRARRRMT